MKSKKCILFALLISISFISVYADEYKTRQAEKYIKEAEYYQKKADGYLKEAQYYLKRVENYKNEAAFYIKRGDLDRAKYQIRCANNAMNDYKTQKQYAAKANEKATEYKKKAASLLTR